MSLLREAERCLANQKAYSSLNAFITPLQQHSGPWWECVRDADRRRKSGIYYYYEVTEKKNSLTIG
jgi:aspartyl-tRNA(Asn)/glutamyl-tRNA(Gln) amidotransferase subunit A